MQYETSQKKKKPICKIRVDRSTRSNKARCVLLIQEAVRATYRGERKPGGSEVCVGGSSWTTKL